MKYDINWLIEQYEKEERLKYVFFWGDKPKKDGSIGKSCLSQWWLSDFEKDGIVYPTAEHWMMAEKAKLFKDEDSYSKILATKHPHEAKKLGRLVEGFNIPIWKTQCFEIIKRGNLLKFSQDKNLQNYLLSTHPRILIEASPYDEIWGIGLKADNPSAQNPSTWRGLNLLGFALMEVRDEILKEK